MRLGNTNICLLLILVIVGCAGQARFPSFPEFLQLFDKKYNSTEEYAKREALYKDTVAVLETITDYTPAVNELSDMTVEEIQNLKNLKKADVDTRLARPLPLQSRLGYPASLDWRELGVVTSIKSQGNCGACWAFATAAYAESKMIIQKRFTNKSIDLSEQYLLSCTKNSDCYGGYLEQSFKVGLKIPSQTKYPYTPLSAQPSDICSAVGVQAGLQSYDYYNLGDSELINFLQAGPVAISINADNWEFYGSGVFSCAANSQPNHAVLLVGYTPTYWIVKNQWKASWGQSGFMYVTRTANKNCAIGHSAHIMKGLGDSSNDKYFVVSYNDSIPDTPTTATTTTLYSAYQVGLALLALLLIVVY